MTTMLVPVGIAYAEASGVPGINGLYATIVPLLAYAVFGPSRILVLGPDSALAAVILAVVLPLSAGEPQRAVALAGMMAIVSGVVCVAAGLARLGFITELLSKPIRYGYMNGIALTVLLSQIPKLFGFSVTADGPLRQALGIVEKVLAGSTNVVALAIGASTLVLILVLKRRPRVPGILIAVIAATVAVAVFDLATRCRHVRARSFATGAADAKRFRSATSTASCRSSWAASRSPSFRSPTRACSLEPMRRVCVHRSTRTRRWWASASPTSRPASFRASRSAAARRAHRWPRRRAPGPS